MGEARAPPACSPCCGMLWSARASSRSGRAGDSYAPARPCCAVRGLPGIGAARPAGQLCGTPAHSVRAGCLCRQGPAPTRPILPPSTPPQPSCACSSNTCPPNAGRLCRQGAAQQDRPGERGGEGARGGPHPRHQPHRGDHRVPAGGGQAGGRQRASERERASLNTHAVGVLQPGLLGGRRRAPAAPGWAGWRSAALHLCAALPAHASRLRFSLFAAPGRRESTWTESLGCSRLTLRRFLAWTPPSSR